MVRIPSRGPLAAALLLCAAPAAADAGLRPIGFGPVQRSMGGAAVAAPLDSAAIAVNPAGLARLGARLDAGLTWVRSDVEYTASGTRLASDPPEAFPPTLGFAYPLGDRLTAGVGAWVSRSSTLYGASTATTWSVARVAPAAAWKLDDRIAIGAAFHLARARMEYVAPEPATFVSELPRDATSALGVGASLGVTWTPLDGLTLGAAWESPTRFGDFEWRVPDHALEADGALVGGTERLDMDLPQAVTVGAGWQATRSLLVAADLLWIDWSSTHGGDRPRFTTDPAATGAMPWDMGWSDQFVVKVGAQLAATSALSLRAGYAWGRMPLDEDRALENIALPAAAEHHVTVGAGWAFGRLAVNVAGLWSPEASVSGAAPDQGIASYEVRTSHLGVDLGVAYAF